MGKTSSTISPEEWKRLRDSGMSAADIHSGVANGTLTNRSVTGYVTGDNNPFSRNTSGRTEQTLSNLFSNNYFGNAPSGSFVSDEQKIPDNFVGLRDQYEKETGATGPMHLGVDPGYVAPGLANAEASMHSRWMDSDKPAYEYLRRGLEGATPYETQQALGAIQSTNPYDYTTGKPVNVGNEYARYVNNQEAIRNGMNAQPSMTAEEELAQRQKDKQKFLNDIEKDVREEGKWTTPEAVQTEVNRRYQQAILDNDEVRKNEEMINTTLPQEIHSGRVYAANQQQETYGDIIAPMKESLSFPEVQAKIAEKTHDPNYDWRPVAEQFIKTLHPDYSSSRQERTINQVISYLDGSQDITNMPDFDRFVSFVYNNNLLDGSTGDITNTYLNYAPTHS